MSDASPAPVPPPSVALASVRPMPRVSTSRAATPRAVGGGSRRGTPRHSRIVTRADSPDRLRSPDGRGLRPVSHAEEETDESETVLSSYARNAAPTVAERPTAFTAQTLQFVQQHTARSVYDNADAKFFTGTHLDKSTVKDIEFRCITPVTDRNVWAAERDGRITVLDLERGTIVSRGERKRSCFALSLCVVGECLVWAGFSDGFIRVFEAGTTDPSAAPPLYEGKAHAGAVTVLLASRDGTLVFSGSDDFTVTMWDADTVEKRGMLSGHSLPIRSMHEVASRLFTGSDDGAIAVWNVNSLLPHADLGGNLHLQAKAHQGGVRSITSTPHHVWTGGADGIVRVWKIQDPVVATKQRHNNNTDADADAAPRPLMKLVHMIGAPHNGPITTLQVVGSHLWAVCFATIFVWDTETFEPHGQMAKHDGYIVGVAPVHQSLVSSIWSIGNEGGIKVWTAESSYSGALRVQRTQEIADLEHEVRRSREDANAIREKAVSLQTQLTQVTDERDAARRAVTEGRAGAAAAQAETDKLRKTLADADAKIAELEAAARREHGDATEEKLKKLLRRGMRASGEKPRPASSPTDVAGSFDSTLAELDTQHGVGELEALVAKVNSIIDGRKKRARKEAAEGALPPVELEEERALELARRHAQAVRTHAAMASLSAEIEVITAAAHASLAAPSGHGYNLTAAAALANADAAKLSDDERAEVRRAIDAVAMPYVPSETKVDSKPSAIASDSAPPRLGNRRGQGPTAATPGAAAATKSTNPVTLADLVLNSSRAQIDPELVARLAAANATSNSSCAAGGGHSLVIQRADIMISANDVNAEAPHVMSGTGSDDSAMSPIRRRTRPNDAESTTAVRVPMLAMPLVLLTAPECDELRAIRPLASAASPSNNGRTSPAPMVPAAGSSTVAVPDMAVAIELPAIGTVSAEDQATINRIAARVLALTPEEVAQKRLEEEQNGASTEGQRVRQHRQQLQQQLHDAQEAIYGDAVTQQLEEAANALHSRAQETLQHLRATALAAVQAAEAKSRQQCVTVAGQIADRIDLLLAAVADGVTGIELSLGLDGRSPSVLESPAVANMDADDDAGGTSNHPAVMALTRHIHSIAARANIASTEVGLRSLTRRSSLVAAACQPVVALRSSIGSVVDLTSGPAAVQEALLDEVTAKLAQVRAVAAEASDVLAKSVVPYAVTRSHVADDDNGDHEANDSGAAVKASGDEVIVHTATAASNRLRALEEKLREMQDALTQAEKRAEESESKATTSEEQRRATEAELRDERQREANRNDHAAAVVQMEDAASTPPSATTAATAATEPTAPTSAAQVDQPSRQVEESGLVEPAATSVSATAAESEVVIRELEEQRDADRAAVEALRAHVERLEALVAAKAASRSRHASPVRTRHAPADAGESTRSEVGGAASPDRSAGSLSWSTRDASASTTSVVGSRPINAKVASPKTTELPPPRLRRGPGRARSTSFSTSPATASRVADSPTTSSRGTVGNTGSPAAADNDASSALTTDAAANAAHGSSEPCDGAVRSPDAQTATPPPNEPVEEQDASRDRQRAQSEESAASSRDSFESLCARAQEVTTAVEAAFASSSEREDIVLTEVGDDDDKIIVRLAVVAYRELRGYVAAVEAALSIRQQADERATNEASTYDPANAVMADMPARTEEAVDAVEQLQRRRAVDEAALETLRSQIDHLEHVVERDGGGDVTPTSSETDANEEVPEDTSAARDGATQASPTTADRTSATEPPPTPRDGSTQAAPTTAEGASETDPAAAAEASVQAGATASETHGASQTSRAPTPDESSFPAATLTHPNDAANQARSETAQRVVTPQHSSTQASPVTKEGASETDPAATASEACVQAGAPASEAQHGESQTSRPHSPAGNAADEEPRRASTTTTNRAQSSDTAAQARPATAERTSETVPTDVADTSVQAGGPPPASQADASQPSPREDAGGDSAAAAAERVVVAGAAESHDGAVQTSARTSPHTVQQQQQCHSEAQTTAQQASDAETQAQRSETSNVTTATAVIMADATGTQTSEPLSSGRVDASAGETQTSPPPPRAVTTQKSAQTSRKQTPVTGGATTRGSASPSRAASPTKRQAAAAPEHDQAEDADEVTVLAQRVANVTSTVEQALLRRSASLSLPASPKDNELSAASADSSSNARVLEHIERLLASNADGGDRQDLNEDLRLRAVTDSILKLQFAQPHRDGQPPPATTAATAIDDNEAAAALRAHVRRLEEVIAAARRDAVPEVGGAVGPEAPDRADANPDTNKADVKSSAPPRTGRRNNRRGRNGKRDASRTPPPENRAEESTGTGDGAPTADTVHCDGAGQPAPATAASANLSEVMDRAEKATSDVQTLLSDRPAPSHSADPTVKPDESWPAFLAEVEAAAGQAHAGAAVTEAASVEQRRNDVVDAVRQLAVAAGNAESITQPDAVNAAEEGDADSLEATMEKLRSQLRTDLSPARDATVAGADSTVPEDPTEPAAAAAADDSDAAQAPQRRQRSVTLVVDDAAAASNRASRSSSKAARSRDNSPSQHNDDAAQPSSEPSPSSGKSKKEVDKLRREFKKTKEALKKAESERDSAQAECAVLRADRASTPAAPGETEESAAERTRRANAARLREIEAMQRKHKAELDDQRKEGKRRRDEMRAEMAALQEEMVEDLRSKQLELRQLRAAIVEHEEAEARAHIVAEYRSERVDLHAHAADVAARQAVTAEVDANAAETAANKQQYDSEVATMHTHQADVEAEVGARAEAAIAEAVARADIAEQRYQAQVAHSNDMNAEAQRDAKQRAEAAEADFSTRAEAAERDAAERAEAAEAEFRKRNDSLDAQFAVLTSEANDRADIVEEWAAAIESSLVAAMQRLNACINAEVLRGVANMTLHHHGIFVDLRGEFLEACQLLAAETSRVHTELEAKYGERLARHSALVDELEGMELENKKMSDAVVVLRGEVADLIHDLRAANQREAALLKHYSRDAAIVTLRQQVHDLEVELAEMRMRWSSLPADMQRATAAEGHRASVASPSPQRTTAAQYRAASLATQNDEASPTHETPDRPTTANQTDSTVRPSYANDAHNTAADDGHVASPDASPTTGHDDTSNGAARAEAQMTASVPLQEPLQNSEMKPTTTPERNPPRSLSPGRSMAELPLYSRQYDRTLVQHYRAAQEEAQAKFRAELEESRQKFERERDAEIARLQALVKEMERDLQTKVRKGGENSRRLQSKLRDLDRQMVEQQKKLQASGANSSSAASGAAAAAAAPAVARFSSHDSGSAATATPSAANLRSPAPVDPTSEQLHFWAERDRQWRDVADLSKEMHKAHAELLIESSALANKLKTLSYIFETRPTLVRSLHELHKVVSVVSRTIEKQRRQAIDRQPTRKEAMERADTLVLEIDVCREGARWIIANLFTAAELQHLGASPCLFEPDARRPTWRDIQVPARMYAYIRPQDVDGDADEHLGSPRTPGGGRPSQNRTRSPGGGRIIVPTAAMRSPSTGRDAIVAAATGRGGTGRAATPEAPHVPLHPTHLTPRAARERPEHDVAMPALALRNMHRGGQPPPPRRTPSRSAVAREQARTNRRSTPGPAYTGTTLAAAARGTAARRDGPPPPAYPGSQPPAGESDEA